MLIEQADPRLCSLARARERRANPYAHDRQGPHLVAELAAGQSLTAKLDVIPCADGFEVEALRQGLRG